jgi:hypothetical protein
VGETTSTRIVQRKRTLLQHRNVATGSWLKERQHILPTMGAVGMQKKKCEKGSPKNNKYQDWKEVLFKNYYLNHIIRSGSSR